jgi:hypothetical protein
MNESEKYIIQLFKDKYNLELFMIPETDERTPDFFIKKDSIEIAVAELKEFIFEIPSVENGWIKMSDGRLEKESIDNGTARVSRKIKDAYIQLRKYPLSKVLILFNNDSLLDLYGNDTICRMICNTVS